MAELIGIVGGSGQGKTTSIGNIPELGIKGLIPSETFIISVSGKALPFRGWKKVYTPMSSDGAKGNYREVNSSAKIITALNFISNNRTEVKNIVIDDYNYIMGFEFFERANEKGFDKFNQIGQNGALPLIKAKALRDDLKIFVICHDETIMIDGLTPKRKMQTLGKMIDDKLTMEGLFTIVLFTENYKQEDGSIARSFITNSDGITTAKSPVGMFPELKIKNDLGYVVECIDKYYYGE